MIILTDLNDSRNQWTCAKTLRKEIMSPIPMSAGGHIWESGLGICLGSLLNEKLLKAGQMMQTITLTISNP